MTTYVKFSIVNMDINLSAVDRRVEVVLSWFEILMVVVVLLMGLEARGCICWVSDLGRLVLCISLVV